MQWCCAENLNGSRIPASTTLFVLRISYIQYSYITHEAKSSNSSDGFGVLRFATFQHLSWVTSTSNHIWNCDGAMIEVLFVIRLGSLGVRFAVGGIKLHPCLTLVRSMLEALCLKHLFWKKLSFFIKNSSFT